MTNPIRIHASLLRSLREATQKSVENLFPVAASGKVEFDRVTLAAIIILLKFHPNEPVGEHYIEKLKRNIRWQEEDNFSPPTIDKSRIVYSGIPTDGDPYMLVLDAIAEYGKALHERKEKDNKDSA